MKQKTSFIVYLFSVFVVITATTSSNQQRKSLAADASKIYLSKIRRDEFPASVEETEMSEDDFKPSATNIPISVSRRYSALQTKSKKVITKSRPTYTENDRENAQKNLDMVPSEEILAEPPTVIELFSAMHMNNYSNNTTKESSENVKIGGVKNQNMERSKVPRIYHHARGSNTPAQPQATNHHDISHPHRHTTQPGTGVVFPDSINEVSSNHFHQDPVLDHHNNHHGYHHHNEHSHSPGHHQTHSHGHSDIGHGHHNPHSPHGLGPSAHAELGHGHVHSDIGHGHVHSTIGHGHVHSDIGHGHAHSDIGHGHAHLNGGHEHGHHHQHDNHFSHPPSVHPTHHGIRYENHHDSGLAPAISKALKFWIPTALLLTGASVLFPQRVKVPTNYEDYIQNRPKRSAHHYSFIAGDGAQGFEDRSSSLRREHRQIASAEDLYDYIDDHQGFQYRESQRIGKSPSSNVPLKQEIFQELSGKETKPRGVATRVYHTVQNEEPTTPRTIQFDRIVKEYPQVPKYDAFRFQKQDNQNRDEGGSENIESIVQRNSQKKSTLTSATPASPKSSGNASKTNGRKVIFIRRRKNQTSTTTSTSIPISYTTLLPPPPPSSISMIVSKSKSSSTKPTAQTKPLSNNLDGKEKAKTEKKFTGSIEKIKSSASSLKTVTEPTTANSILPLLKVTTTKNPIIFDRTTQRDLLLQALNDTIINVITTNSPLKEIAHSKGQYDLSPNGPIVGLLSSAIQYEDESEACQKRALCELAVRGTNPGATKFETFMWSLATLMSDAFTPFYDLEDTFKAIREKQCSKFECAHPNLDIQETNSSG